MERTLGLIKPDAVQKNVMGAIVATIEENGLKIVAAKTMRLSKAQAEGFYAVHKERPFFNDLCTFMSSGPILAMMLEGPDAIGKWRKIMGATDPAKADAGTIRKRFATNIERNAVHGSDAADTAQTELAYFFSPCDINGLKG